jgi:hypothetical protein
MLSGAYEASMIALQLGRPSGIADKDIDIEFPLNIDLDVTDPKLIFEMQNRQIDMIRDKAPGEEYSRGYDQVNSVSCRRSPSPAMNTSIDWFR